MRDTPVALLSLRHTTSSRVLPDTLNVVSNRRVATLGLSSTLVSLAAPVTHGTHSTHGAHGTRGTLAAHGRLSTIAQTLPL